MEEGVPRCGYPTGTTAAGRGAQAAPTSVHTHTHRCAHTDACRAKPPHPPQPSAGTPFPPPVLWGASTVPGKQWGVAGGPFGWRQACWPPHPLTAWPCRKRGARPRPGTPRHGGGRGAVPGRGCWACWEVQVCRGTAGAWRTLGCKAGAACSGQAAPQEHMPCRKGVGRGGGASIGKNWHFSPKQRAWTPNMALGDPRVGVPPLARTGWQVALHVGTWFPARSE